ncbi:MAG: hypothetical protein IJ487_03035 [Ruminococcus sp.]|nr:hypothetical protein [Ruminococcus sp.]
MSDNFNEKRSLSADEASRRAERINAIKNSVRGASAGTAVAERPAEINEPDVKKEPHLDEWESGLAERIDRHTAASRPAKVLTLEEILAELDNSSENNVPEKTVVAEEFRVYENDAETVISADETHEEPYAVADEEPVVSVPEKRTAPIRKLAPVSAVSNEISPAEEPSEESGMESDASETVCEDSDESGETSAK